MRVNTFTFGLLLTCAFASVTVATSVDDVTQMLNGLATNVQGTIDTASIASCGSESIFAAFEAGFLPIMDEVASCNPLDFSDIASKVSALIKTVPDTSKECAKNNADAKKLLTGLGINGLTPDQIKSKITTYVMDNLLSICGTFGDLDSKLKSGDFVGFGTEAGKIALEIFQSSSAEEIAQNIIFALMSAHKTPKVFVEFLADSSSLTQMLEGFVSQTSAAGTDVSTMVACVDNTLASSLVDVLTQVSGLVASANPDSFNKASQIFKDFASTVTQAQIQCILGDANFQKISKSVGIDAKTAPATLMKVIGYFLTNIVEIIAVAKEINTDLTTKDFNKAGVVAALELLRMIA